MNACLLFQAPNQERSPHLVVTSYQVHVIWIQLWLSVLRSTAELLLNVAITLVRHFSHDCIRATCWEEDNHRSALSPHSEECAPSVILSMTLTSVTGVKKGLQISLKTSWLSLSSLWEQTTKTNLHPVETDSREDKFHHQEEGQSTYIILITLVWKFILTHLPIQLFIYISMTHEYLLWLIM